MEFRHFRHLGKSGFKVPVLSFGKSTSGGKGEFFKTWGETDVNEFDSADVYSGGASESILGEALKGRRYESHHLYESDLSQRSGPAKQCRLVAIPFHRSGERGAQALADGLHRHLSATWFRCDDTCPMTPVEETLSFLH